MPDRTSPHTIHVRVTPELHRAIKSAAKAEHRSMSTWIMLELARIVKDRAEN